MYVYVLFVTVSFFVPEDNVIHSLSKALNVFNNAEACELEKARVEKDMAISYPDAKDYAITCEKRKRIDAQAHAERLY